MCSFKINDHFVAVAARCRARVAVLLCSVGATWCVDQLVWLEQLCSELATLVFFVITG